jgi:hypothetical protein
MGTLVVAARAMMTLVDFSTGARQTTTFAPTGPEA